MIIVLYIIGYIFCSGISMGTFLTLFPDFERNRCHDARYITTVIIGLFWPVALAAGCGALIGIAIVRLSVWCFKFAQRIFRKISRLLIRVGRRLRIIKPVGKI